MDHFTLINVHRANENGTVDGSWVQNHYGTIESAREKARLTEEANSNRITVAVCYPIRCSVPWLNYWTNRHKAS